MIEEILNKTGLPVAYGRFLEVTEPPFIVYMGAGQDTFQADDRHYWKENSYRIEYYFANKDEENEDSIEEALSEAGYIYEKSEDVYIEGEDVFVIYYTI